MIQAVANEIVAATRIPPNRWGRLPTAGRRVRAVQIGQPRRPHRRSRLHHGIEPNRANRRRKDIPRTQEAISALGRRTGWRRANTGSDTGTSRPKSDSPPVHHRGVSSNSRGLRKDRHRVSGGRAVGGRSGLFDQTAGRFWKTGALCNDVYARPSGSAGGCARSSNCATARMDRAQTSRSMSRRIGGARRARETIRLSRRMHSARTHNMPAEVA